MTFSLKRSVGTWAGLAVLAGAVAGCDDFLTSQAQGALDELTLQNQAGVEATLVGAYRMLGGSIPGLEREAVAPSNFIYASVTSDDAYKGSEAADGPAVNEIELYSWASGGAQGLLNSKWRSAYEGVNRANATLRLLAKVQQAKPDEISADLAKQITGEALFLRAHFHFDAWRFWGNIPYYVETDDDYKKANGTSAEAVAAMLKDLDDAIAALPTASRNKGRVNAWTAKAYKGRVQAYAGDWAGALATLRDVRNNGPFALEEDFSRVWTGFAAYENGPETILAFQASSNDGDPDGHNANYGDRLAFPHAGSPFGCCGFHQPSQNLVNFFRVDPATGLPVAFVEGNGMPLTAAASWNNPDDEFDADATNRTIPVDPRLDFTVGRDNVPYMDWGVHLEPWIRAPGYAGPYSPKKNVHEKASNAGSTVGWTGTQLNSVNMHLYRYADMLLLLAEAEVEVGSLANALEIVNEIRARAGLVAQGPGTSSSDLTVPLEPVGAPAADAVGLRAAQTDWAHYRIGLYDASDFSSKDKARTAVRYERRLELAMEGQRFFDLRRWGTAAQELNAFVAVEKDRRNYYSGALPVTDRHRWYPLPTEQIDISTVGGEQRLKQNPGW